jgi:hypothetical protein
MTESNVIIMYPAMTKLDKTTYCHIMLDSYTPTKEDILGYIIVDEFKAIIPDNPKKYLESLWKKYNSDNNPLSCKEKLQLIKDNLSYTSMSVGSIVKINGDYWIVRGNGWEQIYI